MKMILVLIPKHKDQEINKEVFYSLNKQSLFTYYIVCCSENGTKKSQRNYGEKRRLGEIEARTACKNLLSINNGFKYIVMMDRDVVLESNDLFERMKNILDCEPKVGMVALYFGRDKFQTLFSPHVCIRCAMYRSEIFKELKFELNNKKECMCHTVKKQINELGYNCKYLSWKKEAIEIFD